MKLQQTTCIASLLAITAIAAAGPQILSYQGTLRDADDKPLSGTFAMRFELFDALAAGTSKWSEQDPAVEVRRGLFSTILGDDRPFTSTFRNDYDLWLEVAVDLNDNGTFEANEVYAPRQRLAGSAWTIDADRLRGRTPNDFWRVDGNAGIVEGTEFLGTTDNTALNLRVGDTRALRIEPTRVIPTGVVPSLIGGHPANSIVNGVIGSTIGGGGTPSNPNEVFDRFGTVGGGEGNEAGLDDNLPSQSPHATVAGGTGNQAQGRGAFVGGGEQNRATGLAAFVGGGVRNQALAPYAVIGGGAHDTRRLGDPPGNRVFDSYGTVAGGAGNVAGTDDDIVLNASFAAVGGGEGNQATGLYSTIPGGERNTASGARSFAAGSLAVAEHSGCFVWSDGILPDIASTGPNQFIVQSSGGLWLGTGGTATIPAGTFIATSTGASLSAAGEWLNTSDRARKEDFQTIDRTALLEKLAAMPIASWKYKVDKNGVRHIGPTGQDFQAAFGLGSSGTAISTVDSAGVALAAAQGLYELLQEKQARIDQLEARLERQRQQNDAILSRLEAMEVCVKALE